MKSAATGVLPALVLGVFIMNADGAPLVLSAINMSAAAIGFLLLFLFGRLFEAMIVERPVRVALAVLCLQAITIVVPGIEGVHRWIAPGGVRLHPGAISDPILLLTVAALWHYRRRRVALLFACSGLTLHIAQPDAGQATALAAGMLALSVTLDARLTERLALVAAAMIGATQAWLRLDPLPPVDMVENIVNRALVLHPVIGVLAVGTLAILPASALMPLFRVPARRDLGFVSGVALTAYLLANNIVVFFGAFPTPVLGFGASPILGAIFGLGLVSSIKNSARFPGSEDRYIP